MINGPRRCNDVSPVDGGFDPEQLDTGVYACLDGLYEITGGEARCITPESCKNLIAEPLQMCVTKEQCYGYGWFLYSNISGEYCTSTWQCRDKEWYVYAAPRRCVAAVPDPNDKNFVERQQSNFYTCVEGYILQLTKDTGTCVNRTTCNRIENSEGGEICHGEVCPENLAFDTKSGFCVSVCASGLRYKVGDEA